MVVGNLTFAIGGSFRSADLAASVRPVDNVAGEGEIAARGRLGVVRRAKVFGLTGGRLRVVDAARNGLGNGHVTIRLILLLKVLHMF